MLRGTGCTRATRQATSLSTRIISARKVNLSSTSAWPRGFSSFQRVSDKALPPRNFPTSGFQQLDSHTPIEEELLPTYEAEEFYPVRIGEVFSSRYQIVSKLGYGPISTVWLSRDLVNHRHVVLQIHTTFFLPNKQLQIYSRLSKRPQACKECIRTLLDSFEITGPNGKHNCMVFETLGMNLQQFKQILPGKVFREDLLKGIVRATLIALEYLHTEFNIIHTDLRPQNILLGIKDDKDPAKLEEYEMQHPVPRKILKDRTIYLTTIFPITIGLPVLSGLSEARFGDQKHSDEIMPDIYRAPEVILRMQWDHKVDIWNLGVMIWTLAESQHLFKGLNDIDSLLDDNFHLGEIIGILGPPPQDFLERSNKWKEHWYDTGDWRYRAPIPDQPLETLEKNMVGEQKALFIQFLRKMLCWKPEDRHTAGQLLYDPWVKDDLQY